jgi:hypothetical protein
MIKLISGSERTKNVNDFSMIEVTPSDRYDYQPQNQREKDSDISSKLHKYYQDLANDGAASTCMNEADDFSPF